MQVDFLSKAQSMVHGENLCFFLVGYEIQRIKGFEC